MTDDDPIEEARVAAMTGGAAAARVIEVALQAAQRGREDEARLARRHIRYDGDSVVEQDGYAADSLSSSEDWRNGAVPTARGRDALAELQIDSEPDTTEAKSKVSTATMTYDSPERRERTRRMLAETGVADEPREARQIADLNNGLDPAGAAARRASPTARPFSRRSYERQRFR